MLIERVLVAVDDTPDSLAAARTAIAVAAAAGAQLKIIHVSADHVLDAAIQAASGEADAGARRAVADVAVLSRVAALAAEAGVVAETELHSGGDGDTAPAVLAAARAWPADLIVVGKSARATRGEPYVGSQTRQLLEFSELPVLVVPPRRR